MGRTSNRGGAGRLLLAGVVGGAAVAASWLGLHDERVQARERQFSTGIRERRRKANDAAVAAATDLGSVYGLAGISAALAATGRRRAAADVFTAGSVAWVLAQGAKPLANRPRPYEAGEADRLVAVPAGSSWPSGHSAVAAAMGAAVGAHGGAPAKAAGLGLAGFVGFSRVYVGVHYPTDVVAGAGVGLVSRALARTVLAQLQKARRR